MIVTKENIEQLFPLLQKAFTNVFVTEYSGWEDQINPFDIIEGEPKALSFEKEYSGNVYSNTFLKVEIDSLGGEKFIRFVSREYDRYDTTTRLNYVLRVGMEIYANMFDKQVVIIEPNSALKKMIKKDKDINPFTVFLFEEDRSHLEDLAKIC